MKMPIDIGPFHIVGIGGIGMSAIAEVLHTRGYAVQGSDMKDSPNVQRLKTLGIPCYVGHAAGNVTGAKIVVISTAVRPDNPEVVAAHERGLPVIRRAEMLAELMRGCATVSVTGTHGKTTTTSMTAEVLAAAGLDPTVLSGGILNAWNSNARLGQGEWMVVEADESDGTFIELPTQIGIVTNIDPEHMDYWLSIEALHGAFRKFFEHIPFYGLIVAGLDHPIVREMIAGLEREQKGRRVLTYGVADDADIRLANPREAGGRIVFDADIGANVRGGKRLISDIALPIPGRYNALNALAALAAGTEIGIPDADIVSALGKFGGVKRRFSPVGRWRDVAIFDDYAHHPVEIASVLRAAKSACDGRVIAVVQPHRYSRLKNLFGEFCTCFTDADAIAVTPVYSAGEAPIPGIGRDELVEGIKRQGKTEVVAIESQQELAPLIASLARPGDLVITLGAGTISEWAHALPAQLEAQAGGVGT